MDPAGLPHLPFTAEFRVAGWAVSLHSEPRLPGELTREPFLVWVRGSALRLVVTDPSHTSPAMSVLDVERAAALVVATCTSEPELPAALTLANEWLHDPDRLPRMSNVTVAAAAVDVDLSTGAARVVRAGDVEVWARVGGVWRRLFPAENLSPTGRAEFAAQPGSAVASHPLHYIAHVNALDTPEAWVSAPLGLFESPILQRVAGRGFDELVVASDGARLTAERLEDLPGWLAELEVAPEDHPHPSPHGDVTVLHLRRTS